MSGMSGFWVMGMRYNVTILADELEIYGGFKVGADCYKSHTKNVGDQKLWRTKRLLLQNVKSRKRTDLSNLNSFFCAVQDVDIMTLWLIFVYNMF